MGDAPLDGMSGVIMMDLASLFSQRLNWYIDNLSVYLKCVNDTVVALSMNLLAAGVKLNVLANTNP